MIQESLNTKIEAEHLPLNKIFRDYFFSIPLYQRPYSWEKEHALTLLTDIREAIDRSNEEEYFVGSIIIHRKREQEYQGKLRYDVIDGQQRLTTFVILLSVLRHLISDQDIQKEISEFLKTSASILTGIKEGKPRLEIREEDRQFFDKYIQTQGGISDLLDDERYNNEKIDHIDSWKNIKTNAKALIKELSEEDEEYKQKLAKYIINQCIFVVITTLSFDDAYRIFSVINTRGMPLEPSDVLKAKVLGKISEQEREDYAKKWVTYEKWVGREAFSKMFIHMAVMQRKEKLREGVLAIYEKKFQDTSSTKAKQFIDKTLEPCITNYGHLLEEEYLQDSIYWLQQIGNQDWIPPVLFFMQKEKDKDKTKEYLQKIERLAFCMKILGYYEDKRIRRYGEIMKKIDKNESYDEWININDEERKNVLEALDGEVYNAGYCRLVVMRLSSLLEDDPERKLAFSKRLTIEHVLPQTPGDGGEWQELYDGEQHEKWVHKLGNLVLLSRRKNSQAQNYNFEDKKEKYFKRDGQATTYAVTTMVLNEQQWTPDTLERIHKDRLDRLKKELHL